MSKKVLLIVFGVIAILCSCVGLLPGAGIAAINGRDLNTGYSSLSTQTAGLVSTTAGVETAGTRGFGDRGNATITISARSTGKPLFIGVAPAARVDDFLKGVDYDEVNDLNFANSGFTVKTTHHTGTRPADPPADESFWTVSAVGTTPSVRWKVTSGDYRIVLMNADGTPVVTTETQFGLRLDGLLGLGIGLIIGGVIVLAGGIVLLVWGIRTRSRPPVEPPYQDTSFPPPMYGQSGPTYPPASGPSYPPPGQTPPPGGNPPGPTYPPSNPPTDPPYPNNQ